MIDVRDNQPLRVRNEGGAPYVTCSRVQLEAIQAVLDRQNVYYWLDPVAISFNSEPPTVYINFLRKQNGDAIQAILDIAE